MAAMLRRPMMGGSPSQMGQLSQQTNTPLAQMMPPPSIGADGGPQAGPGGPQRRAAPPQGGPPPMSPQAAPTPPQVPLQPFQPLPSPDPNQMVQAGGQAQAPPFDMKKLLAMLQGGQ